MKHGECSVFSKNACDRVKKLFLKSGWWLLLFHHLVFDFWWCSCMLQPVVLYYPPLGGFMGVCFRENTQLPNKTTRIAPRLPIVLSSSPPLYVLFKHAILILRSFTNVHRKIDFIVLSANISYIIQIYQQQCAHHRLETKQSKWSHLDNSKQVSQY